MNKHMNETAITSATDFLGDWLAFRAGEVNIPGFSVAIYANGREIFSQAYGFADAALEIAMTTDHVFGVASQTKMFTATRVLQLSERGLIHLNDRAVQFLPWLATHTDERFKDITIYQLLTHQAGIMRDGNDSDYWLGTRAFPNGQELAAEILKAALVFAPDAQVKYSNLGYALLGQVIEAVDGQSYGKSVTAHIIRPLGLMRTYADWRPLLARKIATGYTAPLQRWRSAVVSRTPMRAMAAAAGAWASPSDLCRFATAHFDTNGSLLASAVKQEAHRAHAIVSHGYDQGYEYGLGFESMEIADRRLVGHGGSMLGYRSATFFEPHAGIAVSVAANAKDTPVMAVLRGIFGVLFHFEDTGQLPAPPQLARLNVRAQNALATMQIVATHDAVVALDPNDWDPFSWHEQLAFKHNRTLRVTTTNSVHASGERVDYRFKSNRVASVRYGGITLETEPATPALQPSQSYTLPQEPAEILFRHYDQHSQNVFRLEVLPEYDMSVDADDSFSVQSLRAWEQGKIHKAKALIYKARAKEVELPPWLQVLQRKNRTTIRVRIVDGDFVPYMQWEQEYFKQLNIPLGNERIVYMPKAYLKGSVLPAGDIIICDDAVLINRYKGSVLTHRTFYDTLHPDGQRLLALKKQILHLAMQYQKSR